jgi:hypothetical protein
MNTSPKPGVSRGPAKDVRPELDGLLDEALEETFPASDPTAIGRSDHAGAPPERETDAPRPRDPDELGARPGNGV